ncbi:MAG: hypothetical protein WDO69_25075 [Pseudomonadota bacterium]
MSARSTVTPVILGPANSEAATGWSWPFVKARARELGVPVVGTGKKLGVPAAAFLTALERAAQAITLQEPPALSTEEIAAQVRSVLGRRRAG